MQGESEILEKKSHVKVSAFSWEIDILLIWWPTNCQWFRSSYKEVPYQV